MHDQRLVNFYSQPIMVLENRMLFDAMHWKHWDIQSTSLVVLTFVRGQVFRSDLPSLKVGVDEFDNVSAPFSITTFRAFLFLR